MTNLKIKAVLQIFLVVTMIFFTVGSLDSEPVLAEDFNVCCEKTLSGEFCQYADEGQCDLNGFGSFPGECVNFGKCNPVCCDLSGEGQGCMVNVPAAECTKAGGDILPDPLCDYQQCTPGCCEIGSQCSYVTEGQCAGYQSEFPFLEVDFGFVNSELECLDRCLQKEKGCCVNDETCTYGVNSECVTGEFFSGQFCSDLELECSTCEAQAEKKCVDGSDDAWWFDSCGNKEDVVNPQCDYATGSVCGVVDEEGSIGCKDVTCDNSLEQVWNNPFNKFDGEGRARKNGESWCQYDANTGPTLDLPGSRHFRHYCYNGIEYTEECKDYREEYCLQANIEGSNFNFAACKPNRALDCSEYQQLFSIYN